MTEDKSRFYDIAVEELDREIARAEFWSGVPIIGRWLADRVACRIERRTEILIEQAIQDGEMLLLPLAKNHAGLEIGETVTVNKTGKFEVVDLMDGKVLLG